MKKNYLTMAIITLLVNAFLLAENTEVKAKKNGAVYYQTLEWESSGVVKSYIVTVEKKVSGGYERIFSMGTKDTTYDVSLDVGSYRFKVDFLNVLGQVAFVTEYRYFDILVTYQPKIKLESDSTINTGNQKFTGEFSFKAENLISNAKFFLEGTDSDGKQIKLFSESVHFQGELVTVKFNPEKIPSGKYRLVVQNPGGLVAKSKVIKIGEDVGKDAYFLSFGYAPKIILNDDFIKTVFDTNVALASYNVQASYLHSINEKYRVGGGMILRHAYLFNDNELQKSSAHLISANANFILDYKVCNFEKSVFCADFYCGFGFEAVNGFKYHFKDEDYTKVLNSYLLSYDLGVQGKHVFNDKFYAMYGIEYESQIESSKADYKVSSLNFYSGIGVQF